ncbi:hypothetical protein [Maribellus maritimus]|uniref:hypothetical protein n=1 Tax=Maribellus maritimus TaxID=2870838 RepID=UPI001EEA89A6|nr:hypothetical protein [Maribellus maritimus]MCG6187510.1 hypothetical protein [Maribellus maritimus]
MKKFILKSASIILAISLLSAQNYSIYARDITTATPELDESVFNYDEAELNDALSELNDLDNYLESNTDATFESLSEQESDLITNIESTASPMGMSGQDSEPPLGIPSFLWGCVFGILGLLVVYIATDNDKEEAKKAMWGCLAGTAVSVVIYVIAFAAVESSN